MKTEEFQPSKNVEQPELNVYALMVYQQEKNGTLVSLSSSLESAQRDAQKISDKDNIKLYWLMMPLRWEASVYFGSVRYVITLHTIKD